MNVEKIPKEGTTLKRKAFWDAIADAVSAQTKRPGGNVKVDEFEGSGSIISVTRERGTSGLCPDVETLTVQFADIIMDCGCLPASPEGPLFEPSQVTDYTLINGIFTVTRDIVLPFFWTGNGGSYNYDAFTDEGCSSFDFSDTQVVGINVICDTDGTFTVFYSLFEPTVLVTDGIVMGTPKANDITCNELIPNGTYTDQMTDFYGIARSGTVMISL